MSLEELMRRAGIWRGGEIASAAGLDTGYPELDEMLPGGGWPRAGLTELLCETQGIGVLSLVLPTLARLSQEGRWVVWVAPPHIPYSPALCRSGMALERMLIVDLPEGEGTSRDDLLWACEQALRFPDCGAALLWIDELADLGLRRLQLAAEAGSTWGVLFRARRCANAPSPAPLRLALEPEGRPAAAARSGPHAAVPRPSDPGERTALEITVLKARGGRAGARCRVEL